MFRRGGSPIIRGKGGCLWNICREVLTTSRKIWERWLDCWQGLMEGYAPTEAERKAAPLVLLGSQMVCVAWFAGQEKYRELFQTNQKMTLWLLEHFTEL